MSKDLKVRIGSPKEAIFNNVKKEAEILIKQSKDNLIVQEEMLKMANKIISEEKENFK
jgi:hypothetical protein